MGMRKFDERVPDSVSGLLEWSENDEKKATQHEKITATILPKRIFEIIFKRSKIKIFMKIASKCTF